MSKRAPVVVAISSASGAGTSTAVANVAKLLREKEGQDVLELNYTFTNLASDLGITSEEIHALAKGNDAYDYGIDLLIRRRAEKALAEGKSVVAGSRMADWALGGIASYPKEGARDLYVWIDLDPAVRTERIYSRDWELSKRKAEGDLTAKPRYEGKDKEYISADTARRDQENAERYMDYYGIDFNNPSFADIIVDSGKLLPEPLARAIYDAIPASPGRGRGQERWASIERAAEKKYAAIEDAMGKVFAKHGVTVRGDQ